MQAESRSLWFEGATVFLGEPGVTYLPARDHRAELARLNAMVINLTHAVVSLYEAVGEIASATDDAKLRGALEAKMEDTAKRIDAVVAAVQSGDVGGQ